MSNSDSHNSTNIYNQGLSEKIGKYGDPKRNLIITACVIVVIALFVSIFLWKKGIRGITGTYADCYPVNTSIYIDAKLTDKNVEKINKLTKLNIKDLPDLVSRLFTDNDNRERDKINKLMSETFDDNFSFGVWNDKTEKSLAVFTVKREAKVRPLFEMVFGKKLLDKKFKGYKVTVSSDTGIAFSMIRDKVYVANNYDALVFVIENHIIKRKNSLFDRSDVRHVVDLLEKERIGTIIIADYTAGISKLENITGDKYKSKLTDVAHFLNSVDVTAISVLLNDNLIYFNSYTPYNLSKIKSKSLKKAYENMFSKRHIDFTPDFLPENTVGFLFINEFRDYIDFMIELSGLKNTLEYDQLKQFIKLMTSLDFDNEILEILRKNATIAAVDIGNSEAKYVLTLTNNAKTQQVISSLAKFLPMQLPSAEISTTTYKKTDLELISDQKHSLMITHGKIAPDLYAIGEKAAVEALIDIIGKDKSNVANKDLYKGLNAQDLNNFRFLSYIDVQGLKKIEDKKAGIKNKTFIAKIKNNVKAVLFVVDAENNVIHGSLRMSLK